METLFGKAWKWVFGFVSLCLGLLFFEKVKLDKVEDELATAKNDTDNQLTNQKVDSINNQLQTLKENHEKEVNTKVSDEQLLDDLNKI